eukprot:CAMPEP_0117077724 /NCGR_PEP_ID=MMETSP0472-20121206/54787_1 /TAXON_ID=693140 ORGANISM="Tiarina fusus, Strain LIS" /NCGR_SAMPLE_ID=MMETSP0472 /ASSEMBLY_ACC=CAM_ASM_000603 /LENGTH=34 /DNA_ID= /DNA_START= /DNA_END= /DNA_ORIENTATION=
MSNSSGTYEDIESLENASLNQTVLPQKFAANATW